jgi:predicted Fe-Mo cluster-binding NifX family protein
MRICRICIPTLGKNGLSEEVSEHFGRAPTFTIVDLETNQVKVVENRSEHFGGMGKPPEIIAMLNVDAVLCSNLGPRAIQMFEQKGIMVYVGASGTVREAIQAFQNGMLQPATDENACKQHRH